jgi:hypothetical protein
VGAQAAMPRDRPEARSGPGWYAGSSPHAAARCRLCVRRAGRPPGRNR